jgi:hypothetical protein
MSKFIATFIILLCYSCEYYKYESAPITEKLVLNAVLSNDSVHVHLSKPAAPTGKTFFDDLFIEKANIQLIDLQTNTSYQLEDRTKGHYIFTGFNAIEEHTYQLKAMANGFESVTAEVVFPIKGFFEVEKPTPTNAINSDYNAVLADITIKDSESKNNYYAIGSICAKKGPLYGLQSSIFSKDQCDLLSLGNIAILSDKCFNEQSIILQHYDEFTGYTDITYEISTISKEFYEYYKRAEQPIEIDLAFVEPHLAYSNVKNGYGIFIAKNQQKFRFKI